MATNENNTLNADSSQSIGQAVIVSGSVQAEAADGSIRELQVNGVVFANETIITGVNGKVSIVFNDAARTQLDLGRMSEVTLDEDVFQGAEAVDLAEVAMEVEQMQEALLQGDPTQDLPSPAAGPAGGVAGPRGGGHPTVEFDLTGKEVTPDSGAETIGVARNFVDPDRPITQEIEVPVAAPQAPVVFAADGSPLAGNYENFLDEEHLADGTNPIPELMTINGDLGDMGVDFGPDGPGSIQFGGQILAIDNLGGGAADSITVAGSYGNLTFYDNGTWSFNVPDNIYHPNAGATGAADSLPDVFGFTITDGNGTPANGTMTFNIYDDGPIMTGVEIDRVVEEEAMELSATAMSEIVVTGANSTSVDSWHFNHNGGSLTIDLLSEYRAGSFNNENPASPWPDLNGDGVQEQVDVQVILLDGANNIVAYFDDSDPALSGDGSTNSADSYMHIAALPPGNYTLAVGAWNLSPTEALLGTNFDPNSWGPSGPYQLTLTGDVDLFGVPAGGEIISQVLSDGNPDENDGPEDAMQPDAAIVNGNLGSIVNMGADNPGTFSVGILENLPGLSSQGGQVLYRMNANGTTIEAYVEGDSFGDESFATSDFQEGGGEERIVFTLDIQSNGDYVYTQLDQLDHEDDGTDSENTALLLWGPEGPVGTVDFIDFSSAIQATDSDLDSIGFPDGIVTFTVVDDIPRLVDLREPNDSEEPNLLNNLAAGMAFGGVQEDALDNTTANFENNPDGDDSEGNLEDNPSYATDQTSLSLNPLVEVGADENLTWDFTDPNGVDSGLTSDNAPVYYHLVDGVLVATTSDVPPADLNAPNIFTFSIDENSGEATFNLNDQLDHGYAGADGEHGTADDIPVGDNGLLFIDNLGQYVQATDFDGDSVTLDGRISITVENDVPVLVNCRTALFSVQEDALGRDVPDVNNTDNNNDIDSSLGNVDDLSDTDQAGYNLSALVEVGADEELTWSLIPQDSPYQSSLESGGETVFYQVDGNSLNAYTDSVGSVFTFTVDATSGEAVFNLNDQIDHPERAGDDYELTISDLGQFVRATDSDGDYVDLTGTIRVDVENDIPETLPQTQIIRTVEEDDMSIANPIPAGDQDLSEGNNEDGSVNADMAGARADNGLQQLVATGADEEVSFSISSDTSGLTSLWSQGEEVSYRVNSDGDTLVAEAGSGAEIRTVFTLTVNENGSYLFDLDDQLDHMDDGQNSENFALFAGLDQNENPIYVRSIDFSSVIQVTDEDEDTISLDPGQFAIRVQDDIPVAVLEPGTVGARVFEDGLSQRFGDETEVAEGNREGAETTDWDEASGVAGSLSQLFAVGADEDDAPAPAITIGITTDQTVLDGLAPLMSQGEAVTYSSDGTTLTASAGGREVFHLNVNADGSWNFDLDDQLDHVDDGNNDENWLLEGNGENLGIDFSSIITGEDFDGDMVTGAAAGSFIVGVQDDIPVAAINPRTVAANVLEDGLTMSEPDLSEGNRESGETTDSDEASGTAGSLSQLFRVGADEDDAPAPAITIGITTDQAVLDGLAPLMSQGEAVTYSSDGTTLIGSAGGREVFNLSVNADGSWKFDLDDQLDHVDDGTNDENWMLEGNGESQSIDFSAILTAEDYDGDMVTGAAEGSFLIGVQDDVPESAVTGVQYFVSEYAGFDNIIGTYQLDDAGNPVDPDILIASSNDAAGGNMGENEHATGPWTEGTKVFLIADGGNQLPDDVDLNNLNFVANPDTSAGAPLWVLQIDGTVYSDIPVYFMDVALNADGYEHFKDENGNFLNEVPVEGGEIRIEDLSLGDADYDDTVLRVETGLVVDEANLADGTNPDSDALTVHGNLFTGEGMLQIIPGADENGTLTVNSQFITTDNSGAAIPLSEQSISLNGDHSVSITVNSEAGELVVYGDGAWEYTLTNNTLVHPDNDPGGADNTDGDSDRGAQDQVQDIFNLTYEDADGDAINPQIVININDDGPETGEAQYAILANEAGLNLVADLAIEIGADAPGSNMTLNPIYDDELVEDGDVVRDNNGEVMTSGGEDLHWVQNSNGSWSAVVTEEVMVPGPDDFNGRPTQVVTQQDVAVFTVALEEDAGGYTGNYTVELHHALDATTTISQSFQASAGGGGLNETVDFVNGDLTIRVTANDPDHTDPDNVNWSHQGIAVQDQFIDQDNPSEQLNLDFIDTTSGEHILFTSARFGLDHLDTGENAIWTAYSYDSDGNLVEMGGTAPGDPLVGSGSGASDADDQYLVIDSTNTTGAFSLVVFESSGGTQQGYRVFEMEGTYQESTDVDHSLSFVVDGTDGDGDAFDQQTFDVTFDGDGEIEGTEADEVIVGSSENDIIVGGGGDDVIFGGEGEDEIDGGAGEDIILGGEGVDTITGGAGADTFDIVEEGAGEVQDYAPDAPPIGDGDELDDLVPPVIDGTV